MQILQLYFAAQRLKTLYCNKPDISYYSTAYEYAHLDNITWKKFLQMNHTMDIVTSSSFSYLLLFKRNKITLRCVLNKWTKENITVACIYVLL